MTDRCTLFESLRESDPRAWMAHAASCAECERQLAGERAIVRLFAAEAAPEVSVPVWPVRRRSAAAARALVGALWVLGAVEVLVAGVRMQWTPASAVACAGLAILALICTEVMGE